MSKVTGLDVKLSVDSETLKLILDKISSLEIRIKELEERPSIVNVTNVK